MDAYGQNSYFNYYTPSRNQSDSGVFGADGRAPINMPHPADEDVPKETRHIFAVDSRQRDFSTYPDPNDYLMNIPEFYKNVKSLELKAAIIPKTEYNIHTCNNKIPFAVGDFITNVRYSGKSNLFKSLTNGSTPADGLSITMTLSGDTPSAPAIITATTLNGGIGNITVVYGGAGYTPDSRITLTASLSGYTSINEFTITVGLHYTAKLREGQYSNTGNPKYYHINSSGLRTIMRSHTPVRGLAREIEDAMTEAIGAEGVTPYVRSRIGWYERPYEADPDNYSVGTVSYAANDSPVFFSVRYVNQYPVLDRFVKKNIEDEFDNPDYYETNACNFNRIDISNQLIVKIKSTDATPTNNPGTIDFNNYRYIVVNYYTIGVEGGETEYLLFLIPLSIIESGTETITGGFEIVNPDYVWQGIDPSLGDPTETTVPSPPGSFLDVDNIVSGTMVVAPWHLMFKNVDADIASLLGFRRVNYTMGKYISPITIKGTYGGSEASAVLYGYGYVHRSDFDWTLNADPEYVILSFRSSINSISDAYTSEANDRVDSDAASNLGRSFAALVFDNNKPAVLQGLTYSKGVGFDEAGIQSNVTNFGFSQITRTTDNYSTGPVEGETAISELSGYLGNTDSGLYTSPGLTKALKGADFDIKKISFKQPISRLGDIAIQFTKFNKVNTHTEAEKYDFKGREHLLLFEIVTVENIKF